MFLSDVERDLLERAASLRATARAPLDPDVIKMLLNAQAEYMVNMQRLWNKHLEDFEKLVVFSENQLVHTESQRAQALEASNVVRRYRKMKPK